MNIITAGTRKITIPNFGPVVPARPRGGEAFGEQQTLTLQPDAPAGKDAMIISIGSTANYGTYDQIEVGFRTAPNILRGLILFDLSSIPDGSEIDEATLSLFALEDFADAAHTLGVYRQKREWVEGTGTGTITGDGATWDTYDGSTAWQTAGGFGVNDCEQTPIGTVALTATETLNEFKDIPLTASVKNDLDYGLENGGNATGWMLKIDDESTSNKRYDFASSDHATAANRPKLVIKYRAPL